MSTSAVRLTETAINKAIREAKLGTAAQIDLKDPDQRGLVLRIGKTGYAAWNLVCKSHEGKFVRRIIGGYPAIRLSAARSKARSLREEIRQGNVPSTRSVTLSEVRKREQDKKEQPSFEMLFDMYDGHIKSKANGNKSWPEARKRLSSMFHEVMPLPLEDVTLSLLQKVIDKHGLKSSTSAAWGMRTIRPILKWASSPGRALLPRDMMFLDYGGGVARRERILTNAELVSVLTAMKRLEGHPYVDCMKFIMLTLLRRSEAVHLRWQDITFGDEPSVLIADTKNGLDHKVPLSRQALRLLEGRRTSAVREADLVFANEASGPLMNWNRAQKLINEASDTSGWHRHDLRRTGATLLGEMGIEPYIIEAALNHTSIHSPLAATYNQSRYRPQVADALQRLADKYDGLVGP